MAMNKISNKIKKIFATISSNNQLKLGCLILTFIIIMILITPFITKYSPYEIKCDMLLPPNKDNLLGTDGLGKDVFSMILYGARTSIAIGLISALISGVLGTLIGGIAGFIGGKVDAVISEIINIFLMIPTFFLILMIVAIFGSSMFNVMIVLGLTSWPSNARLMRVEALSLKERTFVKSAIAIGESNWKILFNYIIPNGIYPIISNTTLSISGAILTEASLSFLGLGDPNIVSWGQMIFDGKAYMGSAPWITTFAGIAILILVVSFYLIGDGLNVVLNPKLKNVSK